MAKKMKKLFSLILALSMVMSMMSVVASAEGANYAKTGGVEYTTLSEAVAAANADTTTEGAVEIEVCGEIAFDSAMTISRDITITGTGTIVRADSYTGTLFTVAAEKTLTLTGVTIDGGNNWTFKETEFMAFVENGQKCPANAYYAVSEADAPIATAPMFVVNGSVILDNGATIQNNAAVCGNNDDNKTTNASLFQVKSGGTLETCAGSAIKHNTRDSAAIVAKVDKGGVWNITGGTISDTVGRHHGVVGIIHGSAYMSDGEIYNTYGSDTNGSVFIINGYMELNGGVIRDNYALYSPANSNNGAIYVYYDGKFVMNGGLLENNYGSQPSGIISNCNSADAEPNTILNGGKVINGVSGTNSRGHDVAMVNPVHVTDNMLVGESRLYNDIIVDEGKTYDADHVYFHGWIVDEIGTQDYTGGGTIDADVTLYAGAEVIHHEGLWTNDMVTVDAIGTGTTLTVKEGATIDGVQVRVLDSVASGNYLNAEEAAAAQAASYVEEEGANVKSPVLYYHRLTAAQKSAIVVTYDYNGGKDAQGWSGCQLTSEAPYTHNLPAPTREGYTLIGWKYAVDNEPETLDMSGTEWLAEGAEETASVRLIAQWGYSVTYTDGVENEEVFADQVFPCVAAGAATPAFNGTPSRDGYEFKGWSPAVAATVTDDAIYTAIWEEAVVTPPQDGNSQEVEKSKTATPLDSNGVSNVALSVGGSQDRQGSDIVFVVDKSSSDALSKGEATEMLKALVEAQKDSDASIKIGFVIFNYTSKVVLPLTELTEENMESMLQSLETASGGTNIDAGLIAAKEMLDADTAVEASRKHMILVSDGLAWAFNDDNNVPSTIVWEQSNGEPMSGTEGWLATRKSNGDYVVPNGWTWSQYWAQVKAWVEADGDTYVQPIGDYDNQSYSADKCLTTAEAQDHAMCMDRALYDAWESYTALQNAGYRCYAVNTSKDPNSIGDNLMKMLNGGESLSFDDMQDHVIYAVGKGSKVVDYIGYYDDPNKTETADESYDFDFVDEAESVILTVGSTTYTTAKVDNVSEGVTSTYSFTAPGATEATFTVEYYKDNGTTGEHFVWIFGEDVSNFAPATLSYKVKLVSKSAIPGDHEADTNQEAILYPKDSDGEDGEPEYFEKPTVEYEVPEPTVKPPYNPPAGGGEEELPDGDVPTTDAPVEEEVIEDEEVPKADVPATGDMTVLWAAMSAVSAAGLFVVGKKSKDEE